MKVIGLGDYHAPGIRIVVSTHFEVPEETVLPDNFIVVDEILSCTSDLQFMAYDELSSQMVLINRPFTDYEVLYNEMQQLKLLVADLGLQVPGGVE